MHSNLSAAQLAQIAKAFPENREEMARYLVAGAEVVICRQAEVGEAPPFAIKVIGTDFWIDCCLTIDEARTLARDLGLRVID